MDVNITPTELLAKIGKLTVINEQLASKVAYLQKKLDAAKPKDEEGPAEAKA